jgi:hypothetical protein
MRALTVLLGVAGVFSGLGALLGVYVLVVGRGSSAGIAGVYLIAGGILGALLGISLSFTLDAIERIDRTVAEIQAMLRAIIPQRPSASTSAPMSEITN